MVGLSGDQAPADLVEALAPALRPLKAAPEEEAAAEAANRVGDEDDGLAVPDAGPSPFPPDAAAPAAPEGAVEVGERDSWCFLGDWGCC